MKKIFYIIILVFIAIILLLKFYNSNSFWGDDFNNSVNEINNITYEKAENKGRNNIVYEKNDNYEIINNQEESLPATKETVNNYEKSEDIIVAKIEGYEIKGQDLCITKYFYSNESDLLMKEIENVILFKLAKENNLTISEEDQEYINDVVEGLRKDIINSDIFKEARISEEEYLGLIKVNMERITLIAEYKALIRNEIKDGTLEIEDEELKEQYQEYLKEYTEWKKNKDIEEYKKISDSKDKILNKYIEYQVSQAEVIIY